jgi:catechol 2,3-dioxygenase-like lactoylglutathione lyase family enzyme
MANQETKTPRVTGVDHVAFSARDPAALGEFYREVLGFQVVPTETSDLGENVFLSSNPAGKSVAEGGDSRPLGFEEFLKAASVPAPDESVAPTEPAAVAVQNVFEIAADYGIRFGD